MKAHQQLTDDNQARPPRRAMPKWHRVYYLLVAFDVLVVSLGLLFSHQIVKIYNHSIATNQEWVNRLDRFSQLGTLAGVVNAPGNNVFETHDIDVESLKMQAALGAFNEWMRSVEVDVRTKIDQEVSRDSSIRQEVEELAADLAAMNTAISSMTDESTLVFNHLREDRLELAGRRMASMNQKYAIVRSAQADLRDHVDVIQDKLFREQMDVVHMLGNFEFLTAGFVLLMVSAATIYGNNLKKRIESAAGDREKTLEELQKEMIERKQIETALRESQERVQDLFENANDIIYTHDLEGNYTSVNKVCEKITGFSEAESLSMNVSQVVAPDYLELAKIISERRATDKVPTIYELEIIAKDGKHLTLEVNSRLVYEHGKPVGVQGIARDITERKLAASEREVISEVLESVSVTRNLDELLASVHQSLKKVLFAENCFVALYDKKTEMFSMEFFVDEFDSAPPPQKLEQSRTAYVFRCGHPVLMTDELFARLSAEGKVQSIGTPPASWVGIPLATPSEVIGVLVCQHYTDHDAYSKRNLRFLHAVGGQIAVAIERKIGEEKLRESEEKYRTILDTLDDGYFEVDLEGKYLFLNDSFCRLTGSSESELVGVSYKDLFEPPLVKLLYDTYHNVYKTGEPLKGFQYELTRKDGMKRFVEESVSLKRNAQGEPVAFIGIRRDCTDRKLAERDLEEARNAALESARLKAEFLANMSHEIRTPMNGVIGMTGLLLDTDLSQDQREFAETIRSSGDALLTIINDILDFSKIEAGKLQFELLDFDLSTAVEGTVELLAERARDKKIELASLVYNSVPTALRGDPGRLRQVLTNLIGNALKFTEHGEVIVRAETESETDAAAVIRFTVSDTGIGIPEASQKNLFQAFTQADGSTTRKYGGTGLGLAISRQLVELMGGEIGVTSQFGIGTTFWFTAQFEKQPHAVSQACSRGPSLENMRALIVDDNATNRKILSHQLTSWGMIHEEADGGVRALEMLRTAAAQGTPHDLAILDLMMPVMDGFELARRIKADPLTASVRLVLLTSYGQRGDGNVAREAGVAAYLTKPVRQSQLFECLTNVLRKSDEKLDDKAFPLRSISLITNHALEETAMIPNKLILLAEDNIVNQKVAVRQLAKLGYRADAVANGREAVEALERIPYDLVLMDCQMPEMDGYEATGEIRRREGQSKHTRVVAMTANALQGDRDKCLAAGMDDYLSKPVKLEELSQLLQRVFADPAGNLPDVAIEMQPAPVDLERLHEAMGEDLFDILEIYCSQMSENLDKLGTAIAAGDAGTVNLIAHNCAGTSANCGMVAVVEPLRALEKAGREGCLQDISLRENQAVFGERIEPTRVIRATDEA
jgi:PAS domain S-box-containing protein